MAEYTYEDQMEYILAKEEMDWKRAHPNEIRISDSATHRALNVLNKAERELPFKRALKIMGIYEKATKSNELEKTIETLTKQIDYLMEENNKLKVVLHYKSKPFWTRIKELFI